MRQALHIFQKDIRYLWREIGLLVGLAIILGRMPGEDWVDPLLIVAAGYLIARLILAEAIPGNNQFWITRPYSWKSLAAAKLLFIVAFVSVPVFCAQAYILAHTGFPIISNWPGLLWSQLLDLLALWLPMAALAAVSTGMMPFIFIAFLLVTAGLTADAWLIRNNPRFPWPSGVEWARDSVAVIAIAVIALIVVAMQYTKRRTLFSRTFAVSAIVCAALAYLYLPPVWAMKLQSRLSGGRSDNGNLQFALGTAPERRFFAIVPMAGIQLDMPLMVNGIPEGADLKVDFLTLTFQGPDGRVWKTSVVNTNKKPNGANALIFDAPFLLDSAFFDAERDKNITLRVSLYFTPFGNPQSQTISLKTAPVDVLDGLKCGFGRVGLFNSFGCTSAFRWPSRLVYMTQGAATDLLDDSVSYSPFPTGINLDDAIESHSTFKVTLFPSEITITVKEPLAHFRRDFEIENVHLSDFAAKANGSPGYAETH